MHFKMQREHLLKPLQLAASVAEKKQTLAILANILIDVEEKRISIIGSDHEVELIGISLVGSVILQGKITVNGKKLLDICRSLPEQSLIEIYTDQERLVVKSGLSRFVLSTIGAEKYPALQRSPGDVGFVIKQNQLKSLIEKTHFSIANQDTRYFLNGLLLESNGDKLVAVATDGHRLAFGCTSVSEIVNKPINIILPKKSVVELLRLLCDTETELSVFADKKHLCVNSVEFIFTAKLVEGIFPDYKRALKTAGLYTVNIDRDKFKQAISRTVILSNEKTRGVRLNLVNKHLCVSANNLNLEEAEDLLEMSYSGQPFEIAFNANYLLDVLAVIPYGEIRLSMTDSKSGALFEGVQEPIACSFVIMPLQL